MDHGRVAETVLKSVGGPENISAAAHCATRLRLVLKDEAKVDQKKLDRDPDIKGTFAAGGMFQIIVGPGDVNKVYDKLIAHGVREVSKDEAKEEAVASQNAFSRFIKMIADIFVPMLPALVAGGLMMALNNILTAEGLFGEQSVIQRLPWLTDYAAIIQLISSAAFASLPVLIGFSAVKRFGGNPYLGAALGAAMISSDLMNAYNQVSDAADIQFWNVFGMEVAKVGYQGQVIPMIAVAWLLAVIEKRLHKWMSGTADFLVTPLVTMIVAGILAFVLVGPVMRVFADGLTDGLQWVYTHGGLFGGLIFGLFYSPIVVTGLHQSFPAIELPLIDQFIQTGTGGDFIFPIASMANMAQGAAALAVFLKVRDSKLKGLSGAGAASAFFGITEPAIFGVTLRLKWPFFCGMIGSAVASAFVALFDIRSQALGSAGILGFVSMIPQDIPLFFVALVISFAVSFGLTYVYASTRGKADMEATNDVDDDEDGEDSETLEASNSPVAVATKAPAFAPAALTLLHSPLTGRVVPLAEVPDPGFASGAVGKGVGIDPTDGTVVAPDNATVLMTFPTGHAIGLRLDSGVELLIHVGIDTVNMNGDGFTVLVAKGDKVAAGTPLVTFDRGKIVAAGYSPITPVLVTNYRKFASVDVEAAGTVSARDPLLKTVAK